MSAANVPQVNPNAPTDTVIISNGVPVSSSSGRSATETVLQIVLQVGNTEQGVPAVNAPVSISNLPAGSLQTFRWE
jgi:hypothetical protein